MSLTDIGENSGVFFYLSLYREKENPAQKSGVLLCNLESLIQKLLGSNPVTVSSSLENGASRDRLVGVGALIAMLVSSGVRSSLRVFLNDQGSTLSALQVTEYVGQVSAGNNNGLISCNIDRASVADSISVNSDLVSLSQCVYQIGLGSISAEYEVERTVQVVLNVNNQQGYVAGEVARVIQNVHYVRDLAGAEIVSFLNLALGVALVIVGINVQNDGVRGDVCGVLAVQGNLGLLGVYTVNNAVVNQTEVVVNILDGANNAVRQAVFLGDGGVTQNSALLAEGGALLLNLYFLGTVPDGVYNVAVVNLVSILGNVAVVVVGYEGVCCVQQQHRRLRG